MTRVTFASYDDSPPLGGQGVQLEGMRAALQRRGLDTTTVSGRGDHAIAFQRRTGRAPLDLSWHLNRHPDVLIRDHPDVIHASGGPGGVLLLRRLSVPLVYTANHTYRQAHRGLDVRRLPAPLEARSYRRAAMVLAISASTAAAVRAMGVAAARVELLPPGVDLPDPAEARREPGRVLFVGRLEPEKGVLDALDVMLELAARRDDVHCVVVGTGSLAAEVRRRAATQPRIDVMERATRAAVLQEYARASLLLMPSRYEGLGLVALEAQAAATPVVGYAVEGLRDAVVEGGVLVPYGRVDGLRDAAAALIDDSAARALLGEHGRDFVRRSHSWDRNAARLEEIYAALR